MESMRWRWSEFSSQRQYLPIPSYSSPKKRVFKRQSADVTTVWGEGTGRRGVVLTRTGAFLIIICLSLGISREERGKPRGERRARVDGTGAERKRERTLLTPPSIQDGVGSGSPRH
ncbi:hypothetical protein ALC62_00916 [Cyphomyrmex costatus]|uniref:Uncharacterized protein n=1 Tax=Cyphomyrmex costatus TaxID=456900 RepID=A0A195D5E0_9HYME|nr:hypothetical protein ALC62_00916 [Cyphomyrmex costatus]